MPRLTLDTSGPARVEIRDAEGVMHRPDAAIADTTASDRPGVVDMDLDPGDASGVLPFYAGHFLSSGIADLELPSGDYQVIVEKGTEFERWSESIRLTGDATVGAVPRRWVHMAAQDWWSADFHLHRPFDQAREILLAEDLNIGVFFTQWSGDGLAHSGSRPPDGARSLVVHADATHIGLGANTEDERGGGAWMLHGCLDPAALSGSTWWHPPGPTAVARAREAGAWIDCEKLTWWETPVVMALCPPDSVGVLNNHYAQYGMFANEAWGRPRDRARYPGPRGFSDYQLDLYYRYLNCGFRLPASAGSASGVLPVPPGYNRVYVHVPPPFTVDRFYERLRAGRSFVTNGPMLSFSIDGRMPGEIAPIGHAPVRFAVQAESPEPIERIEVVANGRVVAAGPGTALDGELDLSGFSWVAARCYLAHPVTIRLAHTSPVYLNGTGTGWDSTADRAYLADWVDELVALTRGDPGRFESREQRLAVLRVYQEALRSYRRPGEV